MNLLASLLVFTSLTYLLHQSTLNNKLSFSNIWEELDGKIFYSHCHAQNTLFVQAEHWLFPRIYQEQGGGEKLWQTSVQVILFVFLCIFAATLLQGTFPELYVVWLWYKTFTFWFNMKFIRNCSVPWKSWAYSFLFSTKRFCHYSFISLAILACYHHTCRSFFPSPLGNHSSPEMMFAL